MRLPGLDLEAGTIYCIGRNYADHAKELNNPIPQSPLVFLKPRTALSFASTGIILPKISQNVHHETEVVIAIGRASQGIDEKNALDLVAGFAVGIDVTARDLQDEAKKKGNPWTLSKGLPTFACVSQFVKAALPLQLELKINGEVRQKGSTDEMIFSIPKLISFLASTFHLLPGDLIFTGTPAGVGPMKAGDRLSARLGSLVSLETEVRAG